MSNVIPFTFEGNAVRVVEWHDDQWWVLADVCRVLEIKNPADVARRLDDDEKGIDTIETPGGPQQMVIVSEAGLYAVIQQSRKPVARRFDRWVRHEVLPSIRRTGSYTAPQHSCAMQEMQQSLQTALCDAVRETIKEEMGNGRADFSPATKQLVCDVVAANGGMCCNCGKVAVVDEDGKRLPFAEHDHFNGPSDNTPENCFLVDKPCHNRLKKAEYRNTRRHRFEVFLEQLREFRRDGSTMFQQAALPTPPVVVTAPRYSDATKPVAVDPEPEPEPEPPRLPAECFTPDDPGAGPKLKVGRKPDTFHIRATGKQGDFGL